MAIPEALSTRLVQIALKEEAEEGVPETLVADDQLAIYNPSYDPDIAKFIRTPVSPTYGSLPGLAGIQLANISFEAELKGSGDPATPPEWAAAIKACGYQQRVVSSLAIGAVTNGPFVTGETIDDGGVNTGIVAQDCVDGDAVLFYVPVNGAFTGAETITGSDSGASADSSAGPTADQGFFYSPVSAGLPSATVGRYMDGTLGVIAGARGNVMFAANQVGEPLFLNFNFQGAYQAYADAPLLEGAEFDDTIPPVFMGANFSIHELAACIATLNVDTGNTLSQRLCANADGGVISIWISNRDSSGDTDPEMTLVADHDFYGRLVSGATGRMSTRIGTTPGNIIQLACPRVEYTNVGEADRDTLAVAALTFGARKRSLNVGDDDVLLTVL